MNRNLKVALAILFVVLIAVSVCILVLQNPQQNSNPQFCFAEIDKTTVVSRVVDGDTFDTTSQDTIRLADVDAPEVGESGYSAAKDFLISLVNQKTVYLDVDDVYRTDKYGRLVCVVYVSYNSTHFKNVNKALVTKGYAVVDNYENEFNPSRWTLYCQRPTSSTSQNPQTQNPPSQNPPSQSPPTSQKFVGSRYSDVYHYPSCYWAGRINPANQIWFTSSQDARNHGYRPCKVCNHLRGFLNYYCSQLRTY